LRDAGREKDARLARHMAYDDLLISYASDIM
jgi:hypothetical protein